VQVLLRHEKLPVTDRRVLGETRRVVEFVLFVRGNGTHVKTDATGGFSCLPGSLILVVGALNCGSEICRPFFRLVVRCCVHEGFLTIPTTESMQGFVSNSDAILCVEPIMKKI
jgi:hypothetical protein